MFARDLNQTALVGRLTRDVEVKRFDNGGTILEFSIANHYAKRSGEGYAEEVSFFDCVYSRPAEGILAYLVKGRQVAISGLLVQERWDDRETGKTRSTVRLRVDNLQLLGESSGAVSQPSPADDIPVDDDRIPF